MSFDCENVKRAIPENGSDDDCFFTTACARAKNLPDNCSELQTLRAFRDGWLKKQEEGPSLIEEYYTTAPEIVKAVNQREDADAVWNQLYDEMVIPCLTLIRIGMMKDALTLYRSWTQKLKAEYLSR